MENVEENQSNYSIDQIQNTEQNDLRGNPHSESRFFLKNSIFEKTHILVALSVLFQNMYKLHKNGTYFAKFWGIYWMS
jgi:hypothetical protein